MTSKTFRGRIASIQPWTKRPGYFLHLDGCDEEFYKFGSCTLHEGIVVTIRAEPGNNRFSDKWEIKEFSSVGTEETAQAAPSQTKPAGPDNAVIDYQAVAEKRQSDIRRSVALKAAVKLEAELLVKAAGPKTDETVQEVLRIAKAFEDFLDGEVD